MFHNTTSYCIGDSASVLSRLDAYKVNGWKFFVQNWLINGKGINGNLRFLNKLINFDIT